jgi:hypothetical protein
MYPRQSKNAGDLTFPLASWLGWAINNPERRQKQHKAVWLFHSPS